LLSGPLTGAIDELCDYRHHDDDKRRRDEWNNEDIHDVVWFK
jgi:hypothetical protein